MPARATDQRKEQEPRPTGRALRDSATAKRVYGDPIELDGMKIIPVAAVRRCGHQEGAEDSGKSCGCSCVSARPVGLVVIHDDGLVEWEPIIDYNRVLLAAAGVLGLLVFLRRR